MSGNTADTTGGGIANSGTLTLTNSTVSGNNAEVGGGIFNYDGTLTLTNSTVSGNTADFGGGGIYNGGTLTMTNSTVSGNTATEGNSISNAGFGTMTLTNSLVDGDCQFGPNNVTESNGGNIESPGNTCRFDQPTDHVSVTEHDLNLGPLADNGGLTETHALGVGSVAIDHIPAVDCEVGEDQRGQPRPETGGTMCDVGAFEVQP